MNKVNMKHKVVAAVAAAASMFCFESPALAAQVSPLNNHADSGWSAYLTSSSSIVSTPYRQKQDASYGYIKLQTINGSRQIDVKMRLRNGGECNSPWYMLNEGNTAFVSNYAYENNGNKPIQVVMRIKAHANYSGTTQASGVWSPDSV